MSPLPLVGLVGGYGSVGRATLSALVGMRPVRIRVGGRDLAKASELVRPLGDAGEAAHVDIDSSSSLATFCSGCRIVVNCAGPSFIVLDRVALAAFAAGADYVDPGGDIPLHTRLAPVDLKGQGRVAVVTAGMMPGLSGLLPRWLAGQGFDRVRELIAYVGGRGRLTRTAAADYLLSLAHAKDDSMAAWQNGERVSRALQPLSDVTLPFFGSGLSAYPFLNPEAERVARELGLDAVSWYNVFEGSHLTAALRRLQGATAGFQDLSAAATELSVAADLDLFGGDPYQLFVLELTGDAGGAGIGRTLTLRATDACALTGTVSAMAVASVLDGEIGPGVHFAAEAIRPRWVEQLHATPAVTSLQLLETVPEAGLLMDAGAL